MEQVVGNPFGDQTEAMEIVQVVTAKSLSARGASCHPAFMRNCLTISQTCYPYLLSRGISTGLFEVLYGEGDAAVIGWVGMSYCDTSRSKIGRQQELKSLHSVEAGL